MQYTLRKIPSVLDVALRRRARAERKSLNAVAVEALARGAGVEESGVKYRDLRDLAGTWVEDRTFDEAMADQDRIDKRLWR